METKRLEVTAEGKKVYDIVIENNFNQLVKELSVFGIKERKLCIVTERQVASYYLEEVCSLLEKECAKLEVYIFQEGEESKNLSTVDSLYHFLITHEFDRKDMLLALGGGVTGDLTGFAAATYLRGIDFVQIPTSLLAQVDSSIGGKTGVDYHAYKNMVGAFYMPKLVYINVNTVKTLSERQYHSGLGEVIKHGLIRDKAYFEWMKDNKEAVAKREDEALAYMIEGSCEIKRAVVEEDPKEHGVRALLNFGHTLGHSIEKLMNFSLAHGECVAVGSLLAADISCQRGYISEEENKEIKEFNRVYGILVDTFKPEDFEVENVSRSNGNEKRYIGNFENTTGYDVGHIYLSIHFYDEKDEGVFSIVVEPEGIWKNGTKKSFEFPIYDSDKEFKYFKVFIGKKSLRLNRKGYSLEY